MDVDREIGIKFIDPPLHNNVKARFKGGFKTGSKN